MDGILTNIFGHLPFKLKSSNSNDLSQLDDVIKWVDQKLEQAYQENPDNNDAEDDGRIGPKTVIFDVFENDSVNLVKVSKDKLSVNSQSAFASLKANCCIYKGKYMYEVQLKSKGVMQIGFCSSECKFSADSGVGDTRYSFGLDGSKQRLWHVYTKKYGPFWRSGDIFGICLDHEEGKIEYYRNGVSLGEAFTDIEKGLALYPAVSLAFNDGLTANFGGSPFRYPVPGYKPLQDPPAKLLAQADILLGFIISIARNLSSSKTENVTSKPGISNTSLYLLIASLLIERAIPILTNSYAVEEKVLKIIKSLCVLKSNISSDNLIQPGEPGSTLESFLTLLWTNLEFEEMKLFLKLLLNYLSTSFRQTPTDLEYEAQRKTIVILTCLCNHKQTRKYFLEHKFFKKNCLPLFLYIKPPDETTLELLLPDENIWTEGLGGSKEIYLEACEKLKSYTSILYLLQKKLVLTLMNNTDGSDDSPSSRKIFMNRFRTFTMENLSVLSLIQVSFNSPTQPAIGLSLLCLILDICKQLYNEECAENPSSSLESPYLTVNHRYFYDGSFSYTNVDRIGGVISHLNKIHRKELADALGENHEYIQRPSDASMLFRDIYSTMFLVSHNSNTNTFSLVRNVLNDTTIKENPIAPGNIDNHFSICEIIDCSVLFYLNVAYKYVVMIADLRDNISHLSNILLETKNFREDVLKSLEELKNCADDDFESVHNEILVEMNERFGERNNIFSKRSIELARKQAWYRSVALGVHRRNLLCWLLGCVLQTLRKASGEGILFAFVPETYTTILPLLLDTVMDFSFHDSGIQNNLKPNQDLIDMAAEFLSQHLADPRFVIASCKDALIQALGTLTCHESGMRSLENCSDNSQQLLVKALLRPYENRAWGQSNWLLLRFWLGEGFAFRDSRAPCIFQDSHHQTKPMCLHRSRQKNNSHTGLLHLIAPSCPSKHFQNMIGKMLTADEIYCTAFLNSLLTQLNWAFSEFIHILQDIQNQLQREEPPQLDPKQLKICAMCFDLTISLMRALEMIITIAPVVFKDSLRANSDNLLGRICQLVIQVLSRVTVPPSCFQFVIDLCLPDLTGVTHFAILTASLGILLALMDDEMDAEMDAMKLPKVSRLILTDTSFQIANLEFVLGDIKSKIHFPVEQPRGNFDPKMRTNIDPLTNEIRRQTTHRTFHERAFKPDPPILKFKLSDFMTHVNQEEIEKVENLIEILQRRQSLLSETTMISDDALCPICYAKQNSAVFEPCNHQSCQNCIIQHLMNTKVCFYCKTLIRTVRKIDGTVIFECNDVNVPEIPVIPTFGSTSQRIPRSQSGENADN